VSKTPAKRKYAIFYSFSSIKAKSQAAENMNSVYSPDTVTANHAQFWFRRFRSGNFYVKDHYALEGQLLKMAIK